MPFENSEMKIPLRSVDSLQWEERKTQLLIQLKDLPSHFNHKIECDSARLKHVYNEIVFKVEMLPDIFKPIVTNLIGFMEYECGRESTAWCCFVQAYETSPEVNIVALVNMAYIKLKQGNLDSVEKFISEISNQHMTDEIINKQINSNCFAELGFLHHCFGLNCAALRYYVDTLEYNEDNIIGMYGQAIVLYEMGKHQGRVCNSRYLYQSMNFIKRLLYKLPSCQLFKIYEGKIRNLLMSANAGVMDTFNDPKSENVFIQVNQIYYLDILKNKRPFYEARALVICVCTGIL